MLPALALAFNAFVWGVSWWPFRLLESRGVHPLWATAVIYLLCVAALLAARPGAWRGFGQQPLLWLLALASGFTNAGFNWAVTVSDVVRVVLLFYLMPAWTVLLAWALLDERPTRLALLRVALALAGVAIVLVKPGSALPWPQGLADWLALGGGFSFALTNVLLRKLNQVPAESRAMAMFGGGAATAMAVGTIGLLQGEVGELPGVAANWLVPALLLGLAFLGANLALQFGAARLNANTTSLIMLCEVVFASASSVALGAAEPSLRTWMGGALVIAAALWAALDSNAKRALADPG